MPLYTDPQCVLRTEFLVACWAVDGQAEEDGEYFLNVLLQVGLKKERAGVCYPTQAQRDAAVQAIGALASRPAVYEGEEN